MNIVGLGNAGCQIAKSFEKYELYDIFCIDTENKGYPTFFKVKEQNSHEEYEKNYKKLKLSKCAGPTTIILSGAGDISGCILRVLEQLKVQPLTVLYVKPDISQLSEEQKLKNKITFGILQQYARSGVLEIMYLISNKKVEEIVEELSLKNYWHDINNIISSTYHMINVFKNIEPLLTTNPKKHTAARIGTFGVINYKTNKEKLFYDLEFPRTKKYFYGINEKTLEEDKEILKKIRSFVDEQLQEKVDAGFAIYSTNYEHNYVYSTHYATLIQEQNLE